MMGVVTKRQEHWDRLAKAVSQRRDDLRLSQAVVRERGGPSDVIQTRVEKNDTESPRPRGRTLALFDKPLEWEPGSTVATLNGGNPTLLGSMKGIRQLGNDALVDELRRRLSLADQLITQLSGNETQDASTAVWTWWDQAWKRPSVVRDKQGDQRDNGVSR